MTLRNGSDINADLDLAKRVQQLLFPKSSPVCSWCCVGVKNRMAQEVGGDYFDFITMPDACQSLFLGDVTGHGLHASVVMSLLYGFIHHATLGSCAPREMVEEVNCFLGRFASRSEKLDHFFSSTLFFAIIDPHSLVMHYVNCGQVPPLVKQNGRILQLLPTAPPLGFFETPEIGLGSFTFSPGDQLLLVTDGLVEARNQTGEQFGLPRLRRLFADAEGNDREVLDLLFDSVDRFAGTAVAEDDMTAILFEFNQPLPRGEQRHA